MLTRCTASNPDDPAAAQPSGLRTTAGARAGRAGRPCRPALTSPTATWTRSKTGAEQMRGGSEKPPPVGGGRFELPCSGSPDRIPTGATALRGRRPRPLDDGAVTVRAGVPGLEPRLTEPESVGPPITPYPTDPSCRRECT